MKTTPVYATRRYCRPHRGTTGHHRCRTAAYGGRDARGSGGGEWQDGGGSVLPPPARRPSLRLAPTQHLPLQPLFTRVLGQAFRTGDRADAFSPQLVTSSGVRRRALHCEMSGKGGVPTLLPATPHVPGAPPISPCSQLPSAPPPLIRSARLLRAGGLPSAAAPTDATLPRRPRTSSGGPSSTPLASTRRTPRPSGAWRARA